MKLMDALGWEQAQHYLPIHARERNAEVVHFAQAEGVIFVDEADLRCYRKAGMKTRLSRFLKRDRSERKQGRYLVLPELKEALQWRVADFAEEMNQPFHEPCLLLFRNAWYHFREAEQVERLCENLYRHLPSGSSLVVGDIWLEKTGYGQLLEGVGFRRANASGPGAQIFERP
jgi:hypothetical protein